MEKNENNIYDHFFERLYEIIDEKPLSYWHKRLGSTAVIQSRWKKGRFPGSAKVIEICNKENISPTWLLLGIGEKYIPSDVNTLNNSYAKEFIEKKIYKINNIDFFLDIFLNLSLENLVILNKIPIKDIFKESENFIQKINLLQKSLKTAVNCLEEELTGEISKDQRKKLFILSFDKDGRLQFVNDYFLNYFGFDKSDILYKTFKLPISKKDKKRIELLFKSLQNDGPKTVKARLRVAVKNTEEWQFWETTTFIEENNSFNRKSIGRPLLPSELRGGKK